jgi:hypothetical protein
VILNFCKTNGEIFLRSRNLYIHKKCIYILDFCIIIKKKNENKKLRTLIKNYHLYNFMVVNYIQCKHCHDVHCHDVTPMSNLLGDTEDKNKDCCYCDGTGYMNPQGGFLGTSHDDFHIEERNFKTRLKEILYCIFPCLKDDSFEYKSVPNPNFYDDLFSMMNDTNESTSLVSEKEIVMFDSQSLLHNEPELELDPDDFEEERVTPVVELLTPDSSMLFAEKEIVTTTVKKIDIPKNGSFQN